MPPLLVNKTIEMEENLSWESTWSQFDLQHWEVSSD